MTQHIFIDIETLPDLRDGARDAHIQNARENVTVPTGYTKEQLAADLGITDKDRIKFTAKESLAAMWVEDVGPRRADEVGDAAWKKTALSATNGGQILMVGAAVGGGDPIVIMGTDEAATLLAFNDWLGGVYEAGHFGLPSFVGHNVLDFDLPFIFRRYAILGIKPHAAFPVMPSRYSDRAYDTMTQWAGFGGRISLDDLSHALGIGGKGDIDGSQVYDYWAAGRIDELVEYCKNDVRLTRAAWERMTFQKAA